MLTLPPPPPPAAGWGGPQQPRPAPPAAVVPAPTFAPVDPRSAPSAAVSRTMVLICSLIAALYLRACVLACHVFSYAASCTHDLSRWPTQGATSGSYYVMRTQPGNRWRCVRVAADPRRGGGVTRIARPPPTQLPRDAQASAFQPLPAAGLPAYPPPVRAVLASRLPAAHQCCGLPCQCWYRTSPDVSSMYLFIYQHTG